MDMLSSHRQAPGAVPWSSLWNGVNDWRARTIDHFTKVETAVSETLLALSAVPNKGAVVTFPHLAGQRLTVLRKLISTDGPFGSDCGALIKALDDFGQYDGLRTMLCHGSAHLTVDKKGQWHLILRLLAFRTGKPHRELMLIDESEAASKLKALSQSRQRLCTHLDRLRQSFGAGKPA